MRRIKENVYAITQPPVEPPSAVVGSSASIGVEGVGSGSGANEAMEKSVAKKSIVGYLVEGEKVVWCN